MGETAEPTTEPRPVENRIRCAPQAISSTASALSLMLGKPKRTSPSGTTSSRYSPPCGGRSPGLSMPATRPAAALGIGPQRFFFLGRQAAFGIARRETAVAQHAMIVLGLDHGMEQFAAQFRRDRPAGEVLFATDQLVGLFENGRRAVIDQPVECLADHGVGRQPARGIGPAADRAHHQVGNADFAAGRVLQPSQGLLDPQPAIGDRRSRAAALLDDQRLDRPARSANDVRPGRCG